MHFHAMETLYREMPSKEIIETDTLLFEIYPYLRKRFTLAIVKQVLHLEDTESLEFVLNYLVAQGYMHKFFELRCPECGKVIKQYEFGVVKEIEELCADTYTCTCGTFTPHEDDITITYAFDKEMKPN